MAAPTTSEKLLSSRLYLTLQEAAGLIGCHPNTLRVRIADGLLPAYRFGREIRVRPADVEALITPVPTGNDAA